MSQNDFTIANQGFPAFRADLNTALQALASNNSGTSAPSTTFANMWWYDSANNIMYIRNEDNDAWIKFAELDQTNDKFILSGTLQLDDGTVSAPALTFNSDTNMGLYRGGTDILKFVTAGADAITINASQNVTIASTALVTGVLTTTAVPLFNGGIDLPTVNTFIKGGGHNVVQVDSTKTYLYGGTGGVQFRTADNASALIDITNAGNVGIGTSSPSSKLDVAGQIKADISGDIALAINRSTSDGDIATLSVGNTQCFVFNSETTRNISVPGANSFGFKTNGSERMRISSSGNVGIGNTNPEDFGSLVDNLVIGTTSGENGMTIASGTGNSGRIQFADNTSSPFRGAIEYSHSSDSLLFYCDGSSRMTITSTGTLKTLPTYNNTTGSGANVHISSAGGLLFRSTSSLKYKNTINDATHGLTELLTLRPVTYKGNNDGDIVFGGLIAEEVHDSGLTEFVQYNDDDEPDALAYGNMVSLCIKAIQELSEKNDAQQTLIESMETRITALEGA